MRRALYLADPRSRTLVLSHQDCLGHLPRSDRDWECPERIHEIMAQIRDTASFDPEENELEISSEFDKAPVEHLARAHSPEYIRFVNDLSTPCPDQTSKARRKKEATRRLWLVCNLFGIAHVRRP